MLAYDLTEDAPLLRRRLAAPLQPKILRGCTSCFGATEPEPQGSAWTGVFSLLGSIALVGGILYAVNTVGR